jgi:hypothetical protein
MVCLCTAAVTLAACGWGFLIASYRFTSQATLTLSLTDSNLAIFQGLMAVYYRFASVFTYIAVCSSLHIYGDETL